MKILSAIAILFLAVIQLSFGQTYFGIKAGANLANLNLSEEYKSVYNTNSENKIGYQLGLIAERGISDRFFLRSELYYVAKGYSYNQDDLERTKTFGYINLPVLIGYRINPDFSVFLGPQVGLLGPARYRDKDRRRGTSLWHLMDYNNLDFGAAAGISYSLTPKLGLDVRYTYGFSQLVAYPIHDGSLSYVATLEEKNNKTLEVSMNYFFNNFP